MGSWFDISSRRWRASLRKRSCWPVISAIHWLPGSETLRQFQSLDLLKLVVPGNHDLWTESKSALRRRQDSGWKHDVALRGIADEHGFHYLPGSPSGSPLVAGDIGFTGSVGWYDYSLRDLRLDGAIGTREYD